MSRNPIIISASHQSRDAKSCVSQARMHNKLRRNMPVIAEFFARETQDFASLLGWRHHYKCWKQRDIVCGLTKVETQNLASHKQVCTINWGEMCLSLLSLFLVRRKILRLYWEEMHLLSAISSHVRVGWTWRETQHFASLLGMRHWAGNEVMAIARCIPECMNIRFRQ